MLSDNFIQVKKLRSAGNYPVARALISSSAISSDEDAFEAMICLFIAGDFENVLKYGEQHPWQKKWPLKASQALTGIVRRDNPHGSLALAREAISEHGTSWDAVAIYLTLLQMNGLIDEAAAYVRMHLPSPPPGEVMLSTVLGEIAVATNDWMRAYTLALSVLSADPNNIHALVMASMANYEFGNIFESLGNATRANRVNSRAQPAILQLMLCYNKLGDFYSTVAAFNEIRGDSVGLPEIHAQLGVAYARLGNPDKARNAYRNALGSGHKPLTAIKGLLKSLIDAGATREREELLKQYHNEIYGDIESVNALALDQLWHRDLAESHKLFRQSLALTVEYGAGYGNLVWPLPEPRLLHDCEQLELLKSRGKLAGSAIPALAALQPYCAQTGDPRKVFAPAGREAEMLRDALAGFHHCPDPEYAGKALGQNDYGTIEESFFRSAPALVVIDNFLAPAALANLREYCEEATIWKSYFDNGYVGATLSGGFSPRVLLAIADELKQAMPGVIGNAPLTQAWAFKYDQRMQGINIHADFANVNVNFWITPEDACADKATGGMVIYDVPAPASWTFEDYNGKSGKMVAFINENNARSQRVPYRENRCVLFDSKLFHTTDEIHFKPGYCNRRVNVTLLFGKSLNTD